MAYRAGFALIKSLQKIRNYVFDEPVPLKMKKISVLNITREIKPDTTSIHSWRPPLYTVHSTIAIPKLAPAYIASFCLAIAPFGKCLLSL